MKNHTLSVTGNVGNSFPEYEKCFFEEKTCTFHKTLKAAKSITCKDGSYPYVVRCWKKDGIVVGKHVVYAYGETFCTVKSADEYIMGKIGRL